MATEASRNSGRKGLYTVMSNKYDPILGEYREADSGGTGAVDSVNGDTGVVVLNQDDIGDGTTYKQYSATEKTKLAGIETAADVTDAANVGAAGAFMKSVDDSDDITEGVTKLLLTAAERTKLSNTSGTNTGDQSLAAYATTAAVAAGYQPLDADLTDIASLTATTDNFMVATSSAWASRTPTQARTQLGLGTLATQSGTFSGTSSGTNTGDNATNTQYSGLAASKQDTLVSATNIKTINGSSVLGSGDLVVSGSAAWGGITGTLSDQTDLQSTLDAKVEYTATSGLDMNGNTLTNVNGAITSYPDVGIALIASQVTTTDTAGVGAGVTAGQAKGTADGGDLTLAGGGADTDGNGGDVVLQVGQGAGGGTRGRILAYGATFGPSDTGALDFSQVTGNQVFTLPNNTGTFALVDGVSRLPFMNILI